MPHNKRVPCAAYLSLQTIFAMCTAQILWSLVLGVAMGPHKKGHAVVQELFELNKYTVRYHIIYSCYITGLRLVLTGSTVNQSRTGPR